MSYNDGNVKTVISRVNDEYYVELIRNSDNYGYGDILYNNRSHTYYDNNSIIDKSDVRSAIRSVYCDNLCPYESECSRYNDTELCVYTRVMNELNMAP